jgi:hypothetical protein
MHTLLLLIVIVGSASRYPRNEIGRNFASRKLMSSGAGKACYAVLAKVTNGSENFMKNTIC